MQTKPAGHGLASAVALPALKQCPAEHARQFACAAYAAPPGENVPAAHGFAVAEPVPGGQK